MQKHYEIVIHANVQSPELICDEEKTNVSKKLLGYLIRF
jgi:hypothetical protein